MDPTQRSSEPTYEPDEALPLSATCQERSRNVVAIGYAAARWAGRLKVTQMQLFVLPVTLSALEMLACNPLSTLVYEHSAYIWMGIITCCYKYLRFHTDS